jgi:chromosome segregation protein
MLKRLELIGFKSFADKTVFEFHPGITGIVGPNGSGKSNVVDAVRWVLGEQSVKSLRGGEMTDVIFNGSSSRRSLGLAEVILVFDNTRRSLASEADEVQIGRRVYRSGEAEYLINNQPCRLKDIKDLFLGSGAGTDAYSIIEQGRVDILLQASPRDRRTIFEEAAGISRFKARKTEALRKLENVDGRMTRLQDLLDELEKQLRAVKLQAAKAERFQEYTARLRELRIGLSLREYHTLAEKLQTGQKSLENLRSELSEYTQNAEAWERDLATVDTELTQLDTDVGELESELSATRQQIAAEQTTLTHEQDRADGLERDLESARTRLAETSRQVGVLARDCTAAEVELRDVENQSTHQHSDAQKAETLLGEIEARLVELHEQTTREKDEHMEHLRTAARLHNDEISYKTQLNNLLHEQNRLRRSVEQTTESLASLDSELEGLSGAEAALQTRLTRARQHLGELRENRGTLANLAEGTARRIADLRAERTGLLGRIDVLQGLERSHEGMGAGVREVFGYLERPDPGPWRTVLGIVADFLDVRTSYAPLIDLALGERAQRFLVLDPEKLEQALVGLERSLSGRVSFLPIGSSTSEDGPPIEEAMALVASRLPHLPGGGVVAPAEQVVRCGDPRFSDLPRRLLKRTLIVRDLGTARALFTVGAGFRCVTLQGELLEVDGTLTVGMHHAEAGILSRKSELRELQEKVTVLDQKLHDLEEDQSSLREQIAGADARIEHSSREIEVLAEQANDMRLRVGQHRERRAGLNEEVQTSRTEMSGLEEDISRLQKDWQRAAADAAAADVLVQDVSRSLEGAEREIRDRETQRSRQSQLAMTARVALAATEERLSGLRRRQTQLEADRTQRCREYADLEEQCRSLVARLDESRWAQLNASATLATQHLRKERAEQRWAESNGTRDELRSQRRRLTEQAQNSRSGLRTLQEQAHASELEVQEARHLSDSLCARLRDDYQVELADLYLASPLTSGGELPPLTTPIAEGNEPPAPEDEIVELHRRLSKLGSVNLDAIQELADLEVRHGTLRMHFDDMAAAQKSLQDSIARLNADSRRLFGETFATIRTHFQELFRKLFGGGQADVVLEEGVDILDSGIEVVARPPGKELRSISLMSGGEKTMTAVALLLAIFRSKPSPFCILDEVDAALDEANVGRFTSVLRDFLDRSQFILITHHKRTMASADVLVGVTMQESGISTQFAVRIADWVGEEGSSQAEAA